MPSFSQRSLDNLATCDERIQVVAREAIQIIDYTVTEGHRSEARQNRLCDEGKSKLRYPNSKHNSNPSRAIDVVPYPVDWNDKERFYFLAGVFFAVAHRHGIKLRWGGDWDMDGDFHDQSFMDLPHFELVD